MRSLSGARYAAIGIPDDRGSFAEFVVDGISERQRKAIGPRHTRQRPRSRIQEITGMLSQGAIGAPQAGQWEEGKTTDSPRGRR